MAVSVKDLATATGLSVGTISNVLNRPDKVSEATRAKVTAAIDDLGYVRNEAARQLRAGMSNCVGVIVLNSSNPFFNDVAAGAEAWAADAGVSVLVGNSGELVEREHAYLDLFEQQRVRGVLLSPVGEVRKRLLTMKQRGMATVLVDRHRRRLLVGVGRRPARRTARHAAPDRHGTPPRYLRGRAAVAGPGRRPVRRRR